MLNAMKRTYSIYAEQIPTFDESDTIKQKSKIYDEYKNALESNTITHLERETHKPDTVSTSTQLTTLQKQPQFESTSLSTSLIQIKDKRAIPKPKWHAPWKLSRVISGHIGAVRAIAVDPSNQWFASGAGDRIIKIWDLATGDLKVSLTGHVSTVRGLCISSRHPYMWSAGEDKMIKCWDLEQNKVIRHYHGHLSGIFSITLHPTLDVLVSTGRDGTARVWDMRTKAQVFALTGHKGTVYQAVCRSGDPQVATCSADATVRLWDLAAGKSMTTLTHHKKAIRTLTNSPIENSFTSASPDSIKQFAYPNGIYMKSLIGHQAIINTLCCNQDGIMMSGADNGSMYFWDYKSGYNFQQAQTQAQPGSLDSEAGIYCSTFDVTGSRLITGEADKSIKIWREDLNATPDTHPVIWSNKA